MAQTQTVGKAPPPVLHLGANPPPPAPVPPPVQKARPPVPRGGIVFVPKGKAPPPADPTALCHPSERTAFGLYPAARLLRDRPTLDHPILLSLVGYTDSLNRAASIFGTYDHSVFVRPEKSVDFVVNPQRPFADQDPVELVYLRKNSQNPHSDLSLWYYFRKPYFDGHNFNTGNPVYDVVFNPAECPPVVWRENRAETLFL